MESHHDVSIVGAGIGQPGEMEQLQACIIQTKVLTHLGQAHLGNFEGVGIWLRKCALFKDVNVSSCPRRSEMHAPLTSTLPLSQQFGQYNAHRAALRVRFDHTHALSLEWNEMSIQVELSFSDTASVKTHALPLWSPCISMLLPQKWVRTWVG